MPARTALRCSLVALVLLGVAPGQPAGAAIRPGRLGIGDSVMLGAKRNLDARGFRIVDAVDRYHHPHATAVGRPFDGERAIAKLGSETRVHRAAQEVVPAAVRRAVGRAVEQVPPQVHDAARPDRDVNSH